MIRLATKNDIPELLRMGKEFFDASGYGDITSFNEEDTTVLINKLIGEGFLLTDGKTSMLGFVVFPMFMNSSYIVAQELFWWVDEESRRSGIGAELLLETEKLAKKLGASSMIMLSINGLNGKKVNEFYEKKGYVKREQSYMRAI